MLPVPCVAFAYRGSAHAPWVVGYRLGNVKFDHKRPLTRKGTTPTYASGKAGSMVGIKLVLMSRLFFWGAWACQ